MKNRNTFAQRPARAVGIALVVSLLAGGAAFAASETKNMSSGTPHPSVIAMNQKVKGNAVSITYAFLPTDGTLDIYSVDSGKVGATPLGKITLKAGDHRDITIALSSAPKEGMRLQAVLEKSGQPLKDSGDAPERTFKVL